MEFAPELPSALTAAVERLAYGHGVKTVLQYEREPTRGVVADLTSRQPGTWTGGW